MLFYRERVSFDDMRCGGERKGSEKEESDDGLDKESGVICGMRGKGAELGSQQQLAGLGNVTR